MRMVLLEVTTHGEKKKREKKKEEQKKKGKDLINQMTKSQIKENVFILLCIQINKEKYDRSKIVLIVLCYFMLTEA